MVAKSFRASVIWVSSALPQGLDDFGISFNVAPFPQSRHQVWPLEALDALNRSQPRYPFALLHQSKQVIANGRWRAKATCHTKQLEFILGRHRVLERFPWELPEP